MARDLVSPSRSQRWLGLATGGVFIVLGSLLLVWQQRTLFVVAWLAGWAVIVWGVRQLWAALREPEAYDRVGGLFMALLSLGLGIAVVAVPDVSLRLLRVLLGISIIGWGLLDTGRPLVGRSRWWGFVVRGLGSLGLGLALIFVPQPTIGVISVLLGALLLLWGVVEIGASWRSGGRPAD